jgi:hypothetical protein
MHPFEIVADPIGFGGTCPFQSHHSQVPYDSNYGPTPHALAVTK